LDLDDDLFDRIVSGLDPGGEIQSVDGERAVFQRGGRLLGKKLQRHDLLFQDSREDQDGDLVILQQIFEDDAVDGIGDVHWFSPWISGLFVSPRRPGEHGEIRAFPSCLLHVRRV